jgi:hypothetical protein
MIRAAKGLERIKIYLLETREYRCVACEHIFRAVDRRRYERPTTEDNLGLRHSDHH